jgi:hypothetical protein
MPVERLACALQPPASTEKWLLEGKKTMIINEVYAYVSEDAAGEGIVATLDQQNRVWIPLVFTDYSRIDHFRQMARQIAGYIGRPVKLYRFTLRKEIEQVDPPANPPPDPSSSGGRSLFSSS